MKRLLILALVLCTTPAFSWSFYGAAGDVASVAAIDLSNVDPTTGRTALGAAATSTVTAHTDATVAVHGAAANTRFFTASETLAIANGGTGATASSAALAALGGLSVSAPVCIGYNVASQTFVPSVLTIASFTAATIDNYSALGTSRYTIPVTGIYDVKCCLVIEASTYTAFDNIGLWLYVDAGPLRRLDQKPMLAYSTAVQLAVTGSALVSLTAGQVIDFRIYSECAAEKTTLGTEYYTYMSIRKVN